jgi:DNA mismatch repair protein MutS2
MEKLGQKMKQSAATPFYPSPGMELDLRGQRAEDALDALDRYLESAFLAGLPFVRIIHGKGTGRLRQVVREALQESPHISRWENGQDKEGGEGVTIGHLHSP